MLKGLKFDLQRFAEGDPPNTPPAPEKTFTQADLDRIVGERLQREKDKFKDYDDLKTKASKFDELETKNKTDLEKANDLANDFKNKFETETAKLQKEVKIANAKLLAASLGVKPERVDKVIKLAELDSATDEATMKTAIEAVLTDVPELKGEVKPGNVGGQSNPGDPGKTKLDVANMSKDDFAALQKKVLSGEKIQV